MSNKMLENGNKVKTTGFVKEGRKAAWQNL